MYISLQFILPGKWRNTNIGQEHKEFAYKILTTVAMKIYLQSPYLATTVVELLISRVIA
jgi:hypothetical protein